MNSGLLGFEEFSNEDEYPLSMSKINSSGESFDSFQENNKKINEKQARKNKELEENLDEENLQEQQQILEQKIGDKKFKITKLKSSM